MYGAVTPPLQVYEAVPPLPKVYSAVPPPLLCSTPQFTRVESLGNEPTTSSASSLILSSSPTIVSPVSSVIPGVAPVIAQGSTLQSVLPQSQSTAISYTKPHISGVTNYNGYSGIYPQATPLQQVALALKQVSSTTTPLAVPNRSALSMSNMSVNSDAEKERRPNQRRKFQELPICVQVSSISNQVSIYSLLFERLPLYLFCILSHFKGGSLRKDKLFQFEGCNLFNANPCIDISELMVS